MAASLKEKMRSGTPALGCWLNLFDTLAAEIIGSAGYDFVMIDLEHGPGSVMDAVRVMQALGEDCVPYARVPANDPVWIKRVLDAGVQGVMVPSVNDAADAAAAVGACHYAPRGSRGMAATIVRASNFGADWEAYVERIEREVLVICQIESQGAVENVEAIAATEGLGYRIFLVRRYLAMDVILPYVAWITLLAFLSDWLLRVASRRLFPWFGTQTGGGN